MEKAFHWCSNLEEAMEELVRISHDGTTIAFVWVYGDTFVPAIALTMSEKIHFYSLQRHTMGPSDKRSARAVPCSNS